MKRLLFALAALVVLAIASPPSFAAITPTPGQILARCPDNPAATDCPAAAEDFLVPRPKSPQSDAQIVSLVLKIATEASDEKVPLPVCLDAADGLRVLAGGVEDPGTAQQIMDIADALCDNIRTAAIGDEDETGQGGGNAPAGPLDFGSTSGPSGAGGTTGENGGGGGGNPNPPPANCGTSQSLVNGQCVDNPPTCGANQSLVNGQCVDNPPTCGANQSLVNGVCVDNPPGPPVCTGNTELVDGVCVPKTPPGPPQCTGNTELVDGVCVPKIKVNNGCDDDGTDPQNPGGGRDNENCPT